MLFLFFFFKSSLFLSAAVRYTGRLSSVAHKSDFWPGGLIATTSSNRRPWHDCLNSNHGVYFTLTQIFPSFLAELFLAAALAPSTDCADFFFLFCFFPSETFHNRSLSKCSELLSDRFVLSAKALFHPVVERWSPILLGSNGSSVCLFAFRSCLTVVICSFKPISIRSCVIRAPWAWVDGTASRLICCDASYHMAVRVFPSPIQLVFAEVLVSLFWNVLHTVFSTLVLFPCAVSLVAAHFYLNLDTNTIFRTNLFL